MKEDLGDCGFVGKGLLFKEVKKGCVCENQTGRQIDSGERGANDDNEEKTQHDQPMLRKASTQSTHMSSAADEKK